MILTQVSARKRKERESLLGSCEGITAMKPSAMPVPAQVGAKPAPNNQLLAGYMAYEFLTKGTLLGQMLDPSQAKAAEPGRAMLEAEPSEGKEHGSYAEVASILKTEGGHIPGIVNPTQLARWIRM